MTEPMRVPIRGDATHEEWVTSAGIWQSLTRALFVCAIVSACIGCLYTGGGAIGAERDSGNLPLKFGTMLNNIARSIPIMDVAKDISVEFVLPDLAQLGVGEPAISGTHTVSTNKDGSKLGLNLIEQNPWLGKLVLRSQAAHIEMQVLSRRSPAVYQLYDEAYPGVIVTLPPEMSPL